MDRQTESKTDGQLQTARQEDGHTDIQTYRQIDIQTYIQTDRHTDGQIGRKKLECNLFKLKLSRELLVLSRIFETKPFREWLKIIFIYVFPQPPYLSNIIMFCHCKKFTIFKTIIENPQNEKPLFSKIQFLVKYFF